MLERFRLDGQVAVITGASRGIGRATALALAEAGANIAIGARSQETLDLVVKEAEAFGVKAIAVAGNLNSPEGMETLLTTAVRELGRVDIVVNNVGGSPPKSFTDTSQRFFDETMRWNVNTAFNMTKIAVPLMLENGGGSIVNIASAAGRFRARGFTAYGTAKATVIALTENLAQDLAPKIRVNCVAPGAIATDALETVLENEDLRKMMVDGTPMRDLGQPEDIAAAVLYLVSPAARYVTGEVIRVDGGIESPNLEMGIPDL